MILFCLKPEVSVSPVYQNKTKYGNRLDDGNWTIANREIRSFIRLNNASPENFAPGSQNEL